jgi:hypothetical protein
MAAYGVDRTGGTKADLLANGLVPLVADWDAGSFEIRAATFESDVATGTAPFTIASTTVVPNLNAATVDGYTWAYLAGSNMDHGYCLGLTDDDHTAYVLTAGDTFTGDLVVDATGPSFSLVRTADSSEDSRIDFCESDGDARFYLYHNGDKFGLARASSSGVYESRFFECDSAASTITLQPDGGYVQIGGGTSQTPITFFEASGNGTSVVRVYSASLSANYSLVLPLASSDGYMVNDGSGNLSFSATPSGFSNVAASSLNGYSSVDFTGIPADHGELVVNVNVYDMVVPTTYYAYMRVQQDSGSSWITTGYFGGTYTERDTGSPAGEVENTTGYLTLMNDGDMNTTGTGCAGLTIVQSTTGSGWDDPVYYGQGSAYGSDHETCAYTYGGGVGVYECLTGVRIACSSTFSGGYANIQWSKEA